MAERTPLRRLVTPRDVSATCLFPLSDDASFVTGLDLVVDGGWTPGLPWLLSLPGGQVMTAPVPASEAARAERLAGQLAARATAAPALPGTGTSTLF